MTKQDEKIEYIEFLDFNDDHNLNTRAYNSLKRMGVNTVPELEALCKCDLDDARNVGEKTVAVILAALKDYNGHELPPCRSCIAQAEWRSARDAHK